MKKFETPELEILKFTVMDVITTSVTEPESPSTDDDMGVWA